MKVEPKKLAIFFVAFFIAIAVLWPLFDLLISLITQSAWELNLANDLLTAFVFSAVFTIVYGVTGK